VGSCALCTVSANKVIKSNFPFLSFFLLTETTSKLPPMPPRSLILCAVSLPLIAALDPADSWLVYAKAAGGGKKVLGVNATWSVPAYPTTRGGGNAPGWWFGIEPNPADVLIQPILAYGDGVPEYQIFTGFYVRSSDLTRIPIVLPFPLLSTLSKTL